MSRQRDTRKAEEEVLFGEKNFTTYWEWALVICDSRKCKKYGVLLNLFKGRETFNRITTSRREKRKNVLPVNGVEMTISPPKKRRRGWRDVIKGDVSMSSHLQTSVMR